MWHVDYEIVLDAVFFASSTSSQNDLVLEVSNLEWKRAILRRLERVVFWIDLGSSFCTLIKIIIRDQRQYSLLLLIFCLQQYEFVLESYCSGSCAKSSEFQWKSFYTATSLCWSGREAHLLPLQVSCMLASKILQILDVGQSESEAWLSKKVW